MARSDLFAGLVETPVMCGSRPLPIPLQARDIHAVTAFFPVRTERLLSMLPAKLRPLSFLGNSLLGISGIEYRKINIGPYNEVIVQLPVRYTGRLPPQARKGFLRERVGIHILIISVTSQAALDSGVTVWGYPKFLSEITFQDLGGNRRTCNWCAGEEEILTFSIPKSGFPIPYRGPVVDFSIRGHELLKNVLHGDLPVRFAPGGREVQISFGPHPVGQKLAALIENRNPVATCAFEHGKGVLDVPDWSVPR